MQQRLDSALASHVDTGQIDLTRGVLNACSRLRSPCHFTPASTADSLAVSRTAQSPVPSARLLARAPSRFVEAKRSVDVGEGENVQRRTRWGISTSSVRFVRRPAAEISLPVAITTFPEEATRAHVPATPVKGLC